MDICIVCVLHPIYVFEPSVPITKRVRNVPNICPLPILYRFSSLRIIIMVHGQRSKSRQRRSYRTIPREHGCACVLGLCNDVHTTVINLEVYLIWLVEAPECWRPLFSTMTMPEFSN